MTETPWKDDREVLEFLKRRYPLYHLSNVFLRDVQFGIQAMLAEGGRRVGYREAERLARGLVGRLEREGVLRPIDRQTWVLHYEPFRKAPVKPAATEKPAARTAPAAAPAQSS